jgi:hypothetical protein
MHYTEKKIISFLKRQLSNIIIIKIYEKYRNLKNELDFVEFYKFVFGKWKTAQQECYKKMMEITLKQKLIRINIKNSYKLHLKKEVKKQKNRLDKLKYFEKLIRLCMNCIVWEIFEFEGIYIKQCYKGFPANPLTSSNYEHETAVIEEINNKNYKKFALYSDLTSCIQICDALIIELLDNSFQLSFVEIKSGEKSKNMLKIIDQLNLKYKDFKKENIFNRIFEKKDYKQLKRMIKQIDRAEETLNLISNDNYEYSDGYKKYLLNSKGKVFYFQDLKELIEKTSIHNPKISRIDECLYIGVYIQNSTNKNSNIVHFNNFIRQFGNDFIYTNYKEFIDIPHSLPVFFLPITDKYIFDILFERKIILMSLNLNGFIQKANQYGLVLKYLSKYDTKKHSQKKERKPFIFGHREIYLQYNNPKLRINLGTGVFIKIFYNFITPLSMIKTIKDNMGTIKNRLES